MHCTASGGLLHPTQLQWPWRVQAQPGHVVAGDGKGWVCRDASGLLPHGHRVPARLRVSRARCRHSGTPVAVPARLGSSRGSSQRVVFYLPWFHLNRGVKGMAGSPLLSCRVGMRGETLGGVSGFAPWGQPYPGHGEVCAGTGANGPIWAAGWPPCPQQPQHHPASPRRFSARSPSAQEREDREEAFSPAVRELSLLILLSPPHEAAGRHGEGVRALLP